MKNLKQAIENAEKQTKKSGREVELLNTIPVRGLSVSSRECYEIEDFNKDETEQLVKVLREIFEARNIIRDRQTERLNLINELYLGDK